MINKNGLYINPYIAGNPVYGEGGGFFGRTDILREVEQVLNAPGQNAVILFGQRRIGKTSILLQLQHSLPATQYTVVYQDLQDKARQPMSTMLAELADEIAIELDMETPTLAFDDDGQTFQKTFLPQVYATLPDKNQRFVLLFDEFDVLDVVQRKRLADNSATNKLFPILRRWLREEPRLAFIFALGRNVDDLDDLDNEFLSTFKGSQTIQVSVLSKEDTTTLITAPKTVTYTTKALDQIYVITNGHPYFTQLLCSLCFDKIHKYPVSDIITLSSITEQDVKNLIPTMLSRGDNVFAWIWDGLRTVDRMITSTLAELLTKNKTVATETEIETMLQNKGLRLISRDLQLSPKKLVDWQLLQRVDGGYKFLVPALQYWIKEKKRIDDIQDEIDQLVPRAHSYYQIAKEEYQHNEFEAAKNNLEQALRHNPDHLQSQILLGDIYLEHNKFEESLFRYEQAYKRDKKQVEAKREEAIRGLETESKSLFEQGGYQAAFNRLNFINEINPNYSFPLISLDLVRQMTIRQNSYRNIGYLSILIVSIIMWTMLFKLISMILIARNLSNEILYGAILLFACGVFGLLSPKLEGQFSNYENTKYSLKEFGVTISKMLQSMFMYSFIVGVLIIGMHDTSEILYATCLVSLLIIALAITIVRTIVILKKNNT